MLKGLPEMSVIRAGRATRPALPATGARHHGNARPHIFELAQLALDLVDGALRLQQQPEAAFGSLAHDFEVHVVLRGRGQLLDVHEQAAVAGETDHREPWRCECRADGMGSRTNYLRPPASSMTCMRRRTRETMPLNCRLETENWRQRDFLSALSR